MKKYNAFLSYNTKDFDAVVYIAYRLAEYDLKIWLSDWKLTPGTQWQEPTAQAMSEADSCVVFLGPNGLGDWQKQELQLALTYQVKSRNNFRLIPVFLPGSNKEDFALAGPAGSDGANSTFFTFLNNYTWVNFEYDLEEQPAFLSLIAGIKGISPDDPALRSLPARQPGESPYRGLDHFDVKHARYYFGREGLVEKVLKKIDELIRGDEQRMLMIVGPSGSGKSSLLRAGLIYQLRAGTLPASRLWPTILFSPGAEPLKSLALSLTSLVSGKSSEKAAEALEASLLTNKDALRLYVEASLLAHQADRPVMLLVDQFEEVFTRCKDMAKQRAFIAHLLNAAASDARRICVVVALRADYYHKCLENDQLAEFLASNRIINVPPMEEEELAKVIIEPAKLANCQFEPGLVKRLIEGLSGTIDVRLPLLEHALLELWRRRTDGLLTHESYEAMGGVAGALGKHADEVYESLTAKEKEQCQRIFLRLVQPVEGAPDARRSASVKELIPSSTPETALGVLRTLTSPEVRLIATKGSERSGEAEIIHESLLQSWGRLRKWIEDNRAGFRILHRTINAAKEWERHNEDRNLLYRGVYLTEALAWSRRNGEKLDDNERRFLERSRREYYLIRGSVIAGLSVVVIAAVVAIIFGVQANRLATEKKRNSDAYLVGRFKEELPVIWQDEAKLYDWVGRVTSFAADASNREDITGEIAQARRQIANLQAVKTLIGDWETAIKEIKNSPKYSGLEMKPILGLVPLGADGQSQLHEFAVYLTGEIPRRDENRQLIITNDSALVLVLVPGGTFYMGACKPDDCPKENMATTKPEQRPIVSKYAEPREKPSKEMISLNPFLISKYEMTQGQWERFLHKNPSFFRESDEHFLRPVEKVSYEDALLLNSIGLTLPTEAQWEYAARAGSMTDWINSYSEEKASEAGFITIDRTENRKNELVRLKTAPVTYGVANWFGLYGIIGNVWEWCLDRYCQYSDEHAPHTGEFKCRSSLAVFRGGGWTSSGPQNARIPIRRYYPPKYESANVGVRPARALAQ